MEELISAFLAAFAPVIAQAVQRAIAGDPDPLKDLLAEHVIATLPAPVKSRIALAAAEAADSTAGR